MAARPKPDPSGSADSAFSVLADQVRRQILEVLADNGECSSGFISDRIDSVGRTTVSTHLTALKNSGVIVERRAGRNRYYSIDPTGTAHDAMQFLYGMLAKALKSAAEPSRSGGSIDADESATDRSA